MEDKVPWDYFEIWLPVISLVAFPRSHTLIFLQQPHWPLPIFKHITFACLSGFTTVILLSVVHLLQYLQTHLHSFRFLLKSQFLLRSFVIISSKKVQRPPHHAIPCKLSTSNIYIINSKLSFHSITFLQCGTLLISSENIENLHDQSLEK